MASPYRALLFRLEEKTLNASLSDVAGQGETRSETEVTAFIEAWLQGATEAIRQTRTAKTLASFIGQVTGTEGETAFVSAVNEDTGERFEAECDLPVLRENHIDPRQEFLCTLKREGGRTTVEFRPLPPKTLSQQELRQVLAEVDSRLS